MRPRRYGGSRLRPDLLARPAAPPRRPRGGTGAEELVYVRHYYSPPTSSVLVLTGGLVARYNGIFREVPYNYIEDRYGGPSLFSYASVAKPANNRLADEYPPSTWVSCLNGQVRVSPGPFGFDNEHGQFNAMRFTTRTVPAGLYAGRTATVGSAAVRMLRTVLNSGWDELMPDRVHVYACGGAAADLPIVPSGYWYPASLHPAQRGDPSSYRVDALATLTFYAVFPDVVSGPLLQAIVARRTELDVFFTLETELPTDVQGGLWHGLWPGSTGHENIPMGEVSITQNRVPIGLEQLGLQTYTVDPDDDLQQPVRGGMMVRYIGAQTPVYRESYHIGQERSCSILPPFSGSTIGAILEFRHMP